MSHFRVKVNDYDDNQYSDGFYKQPEKYEVNNKNYNAELSLNQREFELLKNQIIEKDLIINKLNYQLIKIKEDLSKKITERDCQDYEIKEIQENYEKCLTENIDKTQQLNNLREKNLHLENENYQIKNDLNKKSFKLNEITINYDKIRELFNEVKKEKDKLNEIFNVLNKENIELKAELAAKKNFSLNNNFADKFAKLPKANIESEINFKINSTNISSTDRVLNFNSKSSERNNAILNCNAKVESNKAADYISDSSYNFSNNKAFERATSPYLIDEDENNLINDLKITKNLIKSSAHHSKNYCEYNNIKDIESNLDNKLNTINNNNKNNFNELEQQEKKISPNLKNENNNFEEKNIKDNSLTYNYQEQKDRSNSVQSNSLLLSRNFSPKNFMVKKDNFKESNKEENLFKENSVKCQVLFKNLEDINHKKSLKTENSLNESKINNQKNNFYIESETNPKEKSPFNKEIYKKSPKPPNTKDLGKRSKTLKNLKDVDKNTIEIIDNQNKPKLKTELLQKNAVIADRQSQKDSNSFQAGNKSFSERCITIQSNALNQTKNEAKNLFEKFKIETNKENNQSLLQSNLDNLLVFYCGKSNTIDNKEINIFEIGSNKSPKAIKNGLKDNELFKIGNVMSPIALKSIKQIKSNYSPNQKLKNVKNNKAENDKNLLEINQGGLDKQITYNDKILLNNSNLNNDDYYNFKNKSDKNMQEKNTLIVNEKENIELNIKEIESFIKNNCLKNQVGSTLKRSAESLEILTHQAEKMLLNSKSQNNILLKNKTQNDNLNKNNFKTADDFNNIIINNETSKLNKAKLLKEIKMSKKNDFSKNKLNIDEYYCNLNCEVIANNINSSETEFEANKSLINKKQENDNIYNNHVNDYRINYAENDNSESNKSNSNQLLKSTLSDNTPYNSNFNIYSNLNLSALNKINDKIDNINPNFNRMPAYIDKKADQKNKQAEKKELLTDFSINKSTNNLTTSRTNNKSSKVIFNTIKSNVKSKQQIEIDDYSQSHKNSKECKSENSKGSVFHYQEKLFSEGNLYKKKDSSGKKPNNKTQNVKIFTKAKSDNNTNKSNSKNNYFKNDLEKNFFGIKKSQIENFKNCKNSNSSKDLAKTAKSLSAKDNNILYDLKDLDKLSVAENEKIIQFSNEKEKILKELGKMPDFPTNQKQILKKRQLQLNLNELEKVLNGAMHIFQEGKKN